MWNIISHRISPESYKKLVDISQATGQSRSAILRDALDEYLLGSDSSRYRSQRLRKKSQIFTAQ